MNTGTISSNSLNTAALGTMQQDVELAKSGDIGAYERLIDTSKNLVTSIALAIVKDVDDSEQVAQQVFISVWQNLNTLKNSASFLPWIRQSTRYTAYNFLRDNKKGAKVSTEQADVILAELADPNENAESSLMRNDSQSILHSFIDELGADDREIVLLYYREEQSSQQVAALLDISAESVRKKLSRARQSLKSDLLKHASKLVYSTAPTVGFSALVSSLLTPSAPVAAASITGAATTSSTSFLSKVLMVLGGSFIGAFMAVFAILWSSKIAMRQLSEQEQKQQFTRYRNETIAWVIIWAFIITAGYTFTTGWWGPVLSYSGFAIGLTALMYRSMNYMHVHGTKDGKQATPLMRVVNYTCMVLAIGVGFSGLIIGLINSGRL